MYKFKRLKNKDTNKNLLMPKNKCSTDNELIIIHTPINMDMDMVMDMNRNMTMICINVYTVTIFILII